MRNNILLGLLIVSAVAFFSPSAQAQTSDLPNWYENSHCHAHSIMVFRSPFHGYHTPYFLKYYDYMAAKGVRVSTRHIKSNANDGALWCSEVGKIHFENDVDVRASCYCELEKMDVVTELLDAANSQRIAQILYYKHYFDKYYSKRHPSWVCKNADGSVVPSHTAADPIICPNSPWREPLSIRARELVEHGVKGIYFDWVHGSVNGCWCDFCKLKFPKWEGSGGAELPTSYEPIMKKYFNAFLREHFLQLQDSMHAVNPQAVAVVSSSRFASLNYDGLSSDLISIVDVAKSEYTIPVRWGTAKYFYQAANEISNYEIPIPVRLGAGWATLRDVSKNRSAHAWLMSDDDPDRKFEEDQFESLLSSAYSHGFVFNPAHQESDLIANDVGLYADSYTLDNKVGPHFAHKRPVKWAAILYDEKTKLKYLHDASLSVNAQQDSLWLNYLLPFHAAYESFKYEENFYVEAGTGDTIWPGTRHPVSIITRGQLINGEIDGIHNLVIPNQAEVDAELQTAIDLYDSSMPGSRVIYVPQLDYYHASDSYLDHKLKIRNIRNPAFSNKRPPIYIKTKDKETRLVSAEFYEGNGSTDLWDYVLAIANDYTYAIPRGTFDTYYPADFDGLEDGAPTAAADRAINIRIPAADSTWTLNVVNLETDEIIDSWYYSQIAGEYVVPLPPFGLNLFVGIAIDSSGVALMRGANDWMLWPNPVADRTVYIRAKTPEVIERGSLVTATAEKGLEGNYRAVVSQADQKVVFSQTFPAESDQMELSLPAGCAAGIYFLSLFQGESVIWNEKLVLVR